MQWKNYVHIKEMITLHLKRRKCFLRYFYPPLNLSIVLIFIKNDKMYSCVFRIIKTQKENTVFRRVLMTYTLATRMKAFQSSIFSELGPIKEKIAAGHKMIDLSIGNPDMPPADFVREEMVHTANQKKAMDTH